jgi:hypothetical protein
VYVYRDSGEEPGDAGRGPDENDAAYWYDLPGTGYGADAPPRLVQEARGPFEPLVSSAGPLVSSAEPLVSSAGPPGTPRSAAAFTEPQDAEGPDGAHPDQAPGGAQEDTATAHARKLEQIKDLYLTAEAIGEANVDKHFDQLLAQQRELISEYFRQSSSARPDGTDPQAAAAADEPTTRGEPATTGEQPPTGTSVAAGWFAPAPAPPDQAETDPDLLSDPGPSASGPAGAADGARVTADQPRAW